MSQREIALNAIRAVTLPPGWIEWTGLGRAWAVAYLSKSGSCTMIKMSAYGKGGSGLIEAHGGGCTIVAQYTDAQKAFDHVLGWMKVNGLSSHE